MLYRKKKDARAGKAASLRAGRPRFGTGFQRWLLWVPLKPHASFWRLLIFAGWPCRTPFSRAENPPIAFIRELKKQVRIGLVLRGEGQSAISDRAGAAHSISNPNATERGFKYRKKDFVRRRPLARCAIEGIARHFKPARPGLTGGLPRVVGGYPALRLACGSRARPLASPSSSLT